MAQMIGPRKVKAYPTLWYDFNLPYGSTMAQAVRRGPIPPLTRGSSGGVFNASGLFELAGNNVPRFTHEMGSGNKLGLLFEKARTNIALWSRDLTNSVWVKSNVTAAKDATGLDGVANSCSTLTATANNGTCLQAITLASAAAIFLPWIKRKTGTGTVEITIDGGTTWIDITSQINSSTFARVKTTQTLANPQVGFRLGTSGDEIVVDMVDCQDSSILSSPIPTTTAAATRATDVCNTTDMSWLLASVGTMVFEVIATETSANRDVAFDLYGGASSTRISAGRRVGGGTTTESTSYVQNSGDAAWMRHMAAITAGVPFKQVMTWSLNDFASAIDGGDLITDSAGTPPTGLTELTLGSRQDGATSLEGTLLNLTYWPERMSNSSLLLAAA